MATLHSNITQRRTGGKDEPEDLRQLRREHGGSLATLKELFADWTEEDLLYAIQDAGGDLELTILRISDGHASQWGEVKGKKKTPKSKTASEKHEFRSSSSQRGGFAGRGRGDAFRGGRGGATRGAPRTLNGGDRNGRVAKTETETPAPVAEPSWADAVSAEKTDHIDATATADSTVDSSSAQDAAPSTTHDSASTDAWSTPISTTTTSNDTWGAAPATSAASTIVKPEPAPQPVVVPAPVAAPAPAPAPAKIPAPEPVAPQPAKVEEPVVEAAPEPTPAVVEEKTPEPATPEPEVAEPVVEEKIEEPVAVPEPVAEPAPAEPAPVEPKTVAPVGPPGLKPKAASQPRRLNQDAPV
ncbi:RNAPII degradation factor, partial [Mortierella polycephala]